MESRVRAAIWTRVSTREQETQNQLDALRSFAKNRGMEVVREYEVEESAWNGKHSAKLKEVQQAGRLGEFSVVLVWALDRLSREGAEATLAIMREFRERGVQVISLQESWTEAPGVAGDVLVSIMGWVAQMESTRRSERIKAGLLRRKAQNLPVGRQRGAKDKRKRRRSGYVRRWEQEREPQ
jgi:DNA invertase Pin-like site-specific DNA recombinase